VEGVGAAELQHVAAGEAQFDAAKVTRQFGCVFWRGNAIALARYHQHACRWNAWES
jgi:hypothetical protein